MGVDVVQCEAVSLVRLWWSVFTVKALSRLLLLMTVRRRASQVSDSQKVSRQQLE